MESSNGVTSYNEGVGTSYDEMKRLKVKTNLRLQAGKWWKEDSNVILLFHAITFTLQSILYETADTRTKSGKDQILTF